MPASRPDGLAILVADDEAPARLRLVELLREDPHVGRIIEAGDGRTAMQMIQHEKPDLVFLDIQMPELTGLELIETLGAENMPLTVFVTAYDQYAMRAFEADALDYLLKPFSDERLEATMGRARSRLDDLRMRRLGHDVLRLLSSRPAAPPRDRLVVKSLGSTRFVRLQDIDWIEGAGVYVTLHVGSEEVLYRGSLSELAEMLDPLKFVRIHRSVIVNIESIKHLERVTHGEFDAILKDGSRTRVSRTYRAQLERRLGQSL